MQISRRMRKNRCRAIVQVPPQPEKLHKTGVLKESWLTLYDRADNSIRRLTGDRSVVENYFFWVATNQYVAVSRRMTNDFAEMFLGRLDEVGWKKISNYMPE